VNYPVWELTMGGGVLIAAVSILHVFVSHFAVGGGLWLVVTEMRANRRGDHQLRDFVRQHSRFFILLTLVFGAVSGVGIWFTIGLVSPQAVSALIHAYVWGWAMEWVFFVVEIAAALVYYYGWEKMSPRLHETVGWIYFGAALISLVIINGIVTFMLTPGEWLSNGEFWTGFFNPTYWPSAVLRTLAAAVLAGLFTLLTATRLAPGPFRAGVVRYCGAWSFVGIVGVLLTSLWYAAAVPDWSDKLLGTIPVLPRVAEYYRWGLLATLALTLWPLIVPRSWRWPGAALALVVALLTMGSGEWVREAARKPFTIHGFLYSNGMVADVSGAIVAESPLAQLVADGAAGYAESRVQSEGVMAGTRWISPSSDDDAVALGHDFYRAHCQVCHTLDGYNGLRQTLAHWNEETVLSLLPRLQHMRALMPPWYGGEDENRALASYLLAVGRSGDTSLPEAEPVAERFAFDVSCGLCHTVNEFRPIGTFFEGWDTEEIDGFLDEAGMYFDEMPGYYGSPRQRALLVAYLHRVTQELTATDQAVDEETAAGVGASAGPSATPVASAAERSRP
jgi:mono/diheme cytochrome c family protein